MARTAADAGWAGTHAGAVHGAESSGLSLLLAWPTTPRSPEWVLSGSAALLSWQRGQGWMSLLRPSHVQVPEEACSHSGGHQRRPWWQADTGNVHWHVVPISF